MKTFWQDLAHLKKPFFALAPMEGATDSVFRQILTATGRPDVFFTEFTNVEGLLSSGKKSVERRLKFTVKEKPLIAQLWGIDPDKYYQATKLAIEMGFDGVDINMGCPTSDVVTKGSCAALIKNKPLAAEIISAVQKAAVNLPVSVKTRIGYSDIETKEWIGFLLKQNLDAITIHGRTRNEMSKVPAHWEEIAKAVEIRNEMKINTVIIGNGDVKSMQDGINKTNEFGVEGIMIGRGVFENAWIFNSSHTQQEISIKERIDLLKKHLKLYNDETEPKLPYQTLKKYFKIYIRDFDGAAELRGKLMDTKNIHEIEQIIN